MVFDYFREVDERFSTYKSTSEISKINDGLLTINEASQEMQEIFRLSEVAKRETDGFFDIEHHGKIDPSGIVKGWAIRNAAKLLKEDRFMNFYVDAGGDIEMYGHNADGELWRVGIRNPFNRHENVKILALTDHGVATSGTAIRGQHIYSPKENTDITEIISLTVIGPDIYEADRFVTAAFAMGRDGIRFIDSREGLEGYMIDTDGIATMTRGFEKFVR
jgi:thiamine biosynthesis lipoprotein